MDYLNNAWGNATQENLNGLQRHQKHAARLVLDMTGIIVKIQNFKKKN